MFPTADRVEPQVAPSQAQTGLSEREFVPPLLGPGTHGLYWLLRELRTRGVPSVGVPAWVPAMPQTRARAAGAPTDSELKKDARDITYSRWVWWRGSLTVDADNRDEVLRRRALFNQAKGPWHPGRHPAMQLAVSMAVHIGELDRDAGARRRAAGRLLDLAGTDYTHTTGKSRYRTLPKIVAKGDRLWALLGAWPWAAFIDESGVGAMPDRWWQQPEARLELERFIREQRARHAAEVDELDDLADATYTRSAPPLNGH